MKSSRLIKSACILILIVILVGSMFGCESTEEIEAARKDVFDLDTYMSPFWKGNVMYNESVMIVSENGQEPEIRLLFAPEKILSVRSSSLEVEYQEGVDWVFEKGKLKLAKNSTIPVVDLKELYPTQPIDKFTYGKVGGGLILVRPNPYMHERQLAVSYVHGKDEWKGPVPRFAERELPKTLKKLADKKPVKIVFYGDSISVGAESSGFAKAPPFMPTWWNLVISKLQQTYDTEITVKNKSVGGKHSVWGKENVRSQVSNETPDLVVIAFGMGDAHKSIDTTPEAFKSNIRFMMDDVNSVNPEAEFILVSTMLANPESAGFAGRQAEYLPVLLQLKAEGTGVAVADITSVHIELLKHKNYRDITGNNLNHPGDFLIRWYAQVVSALLVKE